MTSGFVLSVYTVPMAGAIFDANDERYMQIALNEAQAALTVGDYPVGAVLTVNGELWGEARNSLFSDSRTTAHAEHKLLYAFSARLRECWQSQPSVDSCLYTTLEPCLMCLGIAVIHRIRRIVVACPDPNGGTLNLDPARLGSVYADWWPDVQVGLFKQASCALILEFLRTGRFRTQEQMRAEFEAMQASWSAKS